MALDRGHRLHLGPARLVVSGLGSRTVRTTEIVALVRLENRVATGWEEWSDVVKTCCCSLGRLDSWYDGMAGWSLEVGGQA